MERSIFMTPTRNPLVKIGSASGAARIRQHGSARIPAGKRANLGFRDRRVPQRRFFVAGKGKDNGLFMLHPYMRGLIPVMFVHGTASSPARWAEMANELLGDPNIASHYQFGSSFITAAIQSRCPRCGCANRLVAARKDVDPEGKDPALRQMVVIGHSQGGLLTKMMVVDSGTRFWDRRHKDSIRQGRTRSRNS